ncbi:hypothetical protein AGDE_16294 [Angomonas deanei]|uniref:Uncharacterized protein n=1 Tax=Angomonas deanei TaxID=59799 RepID=A0A7G2CML1_9TRYP|nr:hypothetical protein AGDE_16294 [Angomonas deanei]CAD2220659.1 hypothetical protein, conserved [Angomonas deanei]|eukprot:EPY17363.1 hypothetical protein AGDE_16294 [Angomonas deanei]
MNVYPQIHFMLTFVEALLHRERIAHEETARLEQPPMVFSVLSEFLFINSGNIGSVYGALVALTEGHSGLP